MFFLAMKNLMKKIKPKYMFTGLIKPMEKMRKSPTLNPMMNG